MGQSLRHEDTVMAAAFSPDGTLVLTGSGNTARLWRTDRGAPLGPPLRHDNLVMAVAFSPDGKHVMVATQWWVHLSTVLEETLTPTASRLLSGTWEGYRFLNESGSSLQVELRNTAETIMIESIRLDAAEAEPITGKPEVLIEEWQKKLALKFEAGKIVPLYEVPISTLDSGSRGGRF